MKVDEINSTKGDWLPIETKLDLKPEDTVTITCQSERGGCFVGDLRWYQPDQKNSNSQFIFIMVDTLRDDAVDPKWAPNMSNFAKNAIQFDNALAPGNMTSPSTNALLSCQKPSTRNYARSFYPRKQGLGFLMVKLVTSSEAISSIRSC